MLEALPSFWGQDGQREHSDFPFLCLPFLSLIFFFPFPHWLLLHLSQSGAGFFCDNFYFWSFIFHCLTISSCSILCSFYICFLTTFRAPIFDYVIFFHLTRAILFLLLIPSNQIMLFINLSILLPIVSSPKLSFFTCSRLIH